MLVTLDVFDDDHGYLLLWDIFALVYAFTFLASGGGKGTQRWMPKRTGPRSVKYNVNVNREIEPHTTTLYITLVIQYMSTCHATVP